MSCRLINCPIRLNVSDEFDDVDDRYGCLKSTDRKCPMHSIDPNKMSLGSFQFVIRLMYSNSMCSMVSR